jgi:hypothetical protein
MIREMGETNDQLALQAVATLEDGLITEVR